MIDELSPGQVRVLALMAEGLSNEAIASVLCIGVHAVEKQSAFIFMKLDLTYPPNPNINKRVKAVLWYREQQLGEQPAQAPQQPTQAGVYRATY